MSTKLNWAVLFALLALITAIANPVDVMGEEVPPTPPPGDSPLTEHFPDKPDKRLPPEQYNRFEITEPPDTDPPPFEIPYENLFPRMKFADPDYASASDGGLIEPRVVGGSEVDPQNSYPWVASLQINGFHYCAGTLIAPEWILTAAHCWVDYDGIPYGITPLDTVVLGEHSLSNPSGNEQIIVPIEVHIHPMFSHTSLEYDLALLKLGSQATINDYVAPIALLTGGAPDWQSVTIAGWGNTAYQGSPSDVLLEGQIQLMPDSECSGYGIRFKTGSMLCGGLPDYSVDACQGDSGGPLFFHTGEAWAVAGVTSWGYKCAEEGYPGIYADVNLIPAWDFASGYDCSTDQSTIPESECNALRDLFISTAGTEWSDSTDWLATNDPCDWNGLTCTAGHISAIDLSNNNLNGKFAGDFSGFSSLTSMNLGYNRLSGNIAEIVPSLPTNLGHLDLSFNLITGEIPADLLNFTQLQWLDLTYNYISGDITSTVANLPAGLQKIWLDWNYLTGTIPSTLNKFTNLNTLDLSYNYLDGDLNDILGYLPLNMKWIGLGGCLLTGTIPDNLGLDHPLLQVFDVSYSYLTGGLPSSFSTLASLEYLLVNYSSLFGPIPAGYTSLPLYLFYFDNSYICESDTPEEQTWLATITHLSSSGIACEFTPPSVSILSHTNGDGLMFPRDQVRVSASDTGSGMNQVEFWGNHGGSDYLIYTDGDGSDGWSFVWPTFYLPNVPIMLKAIAYDNLGNYDHAEVINLHLTDTITNIGGYEARQGGGSDNTPEDEIEIVESAITQTIKNQSAIFMRKSAPIYLR